MFWTWIKKSLTALVVEVEEIIEAVLLATCDLPRLRQNERVLSLHLIAAPTTTSTVIIFSIHLFGVFVLMISFTMMMVIHHLLSGSPPPLRPTGYLPRAPSPTSHHLFLLESENSYRKVRTWGATV